MKLGSARFTIPAGQTKTVKVKLSKKALRALRKRGKLKASARALATDARGGTPVATRRKVTLKK